MPFVRRVVVANPLQVRSIAWAKVKTDKIDAALLAKLHASGFLPEVWVPNEETEALRRRIAERNQLVSQMTRLKNRVQSVLHANLIPRYAGKLFMTLTERLTEEFWGAAAPSSWGRQLRIWTCNRRGEMPSEIVESSAVQREGASSG
jgi:transposase